MASLELKNLADAAALGEWLALNLPEFGNPAIFLRGGLGAGKTTLAGYMARGLPGGNEAEISSPSFTICNEYPTTPPVLHCDLYRCKKALPDEILERLESGDTLLIVEWAEYFPAGEMPKEYLDISFKIVNDSRLLNIRACGPMAERLAEKLARHWPSHII